MDEAAMTGEAHRVVTTGVVRLVVAAVVVAATEEAHREVAAAVAGIAGNS